MARDASAAAPEASAGATATPSTRERILEVALRLFTEKGYDATSLREISEELGVTKAALYYHFRTKEEILSSLMASLEEGMQDLATWAEQQEPSAQTREELLQRAVDLAVGPASRVMAMAQQNQTALRELQARREHGGRHGPPIEMFQQIIRPLVPPDADYEQQVRARIAFFSLLAGAFLGQDLEASPEQQREVALRVAHDVLRPGADG